MIDEPGEATCARNQPTHRIEARVVDDELGGDSGADTKTWKVAAVR